MKTVNEVPEIKLISEVVRKLDYLEIDRPVKESVWEILRRKLKGIPKPEDEHLVFPGRVLWENIIVQSTKPIGLGTHIDYLVDGNRTLRGILPIAELDQSEGLPTYECALAHVHYHNYRGAKDV